MAHEVNPFGIDAPTFATLKNIAERAIIKTNENEQTKSAVLSELDRLGKLTVADDSVKFTGSAIILPERFSGDLLGAAAFLQQLHEKEEKPYTFGRTFNYRPWDGAAAFDRAMYRIFGTTGLGKETVTFFGSKPPELLTISSGPDSTLQVPWGKVSMPTLDATFTLGSDWSEEYGNLFRINVTAPRKHRARLETVFNVIQDELENRSIYKGKAFNGAENPEFLDLTGLDESKVVYADEVLAQLNANLWSLIEHTETMIRLGIPLKRAVLVEGPFGTGKSLAGALTAKKAQEHGWTFILARPGKDDLFEVLNTAKLYAPAVVQYEDIDVIGKGGTDKQISTLLDALDGIGNKTNGVLALFTTNHVETLQKGVMRPGRIDSIIHIGALDRKGIEKLIKSVADPKILGDLDYDVIYAEVKDFLPAFVKEAVDRAIRFAVSRNNGSSFFTIETVDIVNAAIGLHNQLNLMNAAQDGRPPAPAIDTAIAAIVRDATKEAAKEAVDGARMYDADGGYDGSILTVS